MIVSTCDQCKYYRDIYIVFFILSLQNLVYILHVEYISIYGLNFNHKYFISNVITVKKKIDLHPPTFSPNNFIRFMITELSVLKFKLN